jgi:hypothetical protein
VRAVEERGLAGARGGGAGWPARAVEVEVRGLVGARGGGAGWPARAVEVEERGLASARWRWRRAV